MADRAATVIIKNMSTAAFFKDGTGSRDKEGTWTRDLEPPARIPNGRVAEPGYAAWRGENTAVFGAPVLGWAIYHMDDDETKLSINFEAREGDIHIKAELVGENAHRFQVTSFSSDEKCAIQVVLISNRT